MQNHCWNPNIQCLIKHLRVCLDVSLWSECRIPTSSHQSFRRKWLTWTNTWWDFTNQHANEKHLTSLTLSPPVLASCRWEKSWESIGWKSLHESCQSIHRWVEPRIGNLKHCHVKNSTHYNFSHFAHAGRAIRHRGDYACIVLCDHRYSRTGTLQKLPEWIRSSTRTHASFGPAFASIRKVTF